MPEIMDSAEALAEALADESADESADTRQARRDFVRKTALGGATAWTAPTLVSAMVAPVAALSLAGTLYGSDSVTRDFHVVDRSTGRFLAPGLPTNANPNEMTYHSGLGKVFGIDGPNPQSLFGVDVGSGAWTVIGPLGDGPVAGLVYDPGRQELYGCGDGAMFTIDPATGAASRLGAVTGTALPATMAYASTLGVLLGVDGEHDALFEVDPDGPTWGLIGPTGVSNMAGLAFDSLQGVLYGCSTSTDSTYVINRTTGFATLLGSTGSSNPSALAFVP